MGLEGGLVTLCQIETHGVMQTIVHSVMLSGHSVASMSKNIHKTSKCPGYQLLKIGDHYVTFLCEQMEDNEDMDKHKQPPILLSGWLKLTFNCGQ